MPVFDGQPVDAEVTNPAFIDAQIDSTGVGRVTLAAPSSGGTVPNIQLAINHAMTTAGSTPTTDGTTYTSHQRITDGQNHPTVISELDTAFHPTTGHKHTGVTGDGPLLPGSSISGNPLRGDMIQGVDISSVTGSSTIVSSQFAAAVPSTSSSIEGVVVNTPYNKCLIRQASGTSTDDEYKDAFGNIVYGRITNSGGVGGTWTLSYFVDISGTETAYSFASASDVRFYYQKLFNPLTDMPVYSPLAFIPSENATADVLPATTTQQGKTQLSTSSTDVSGSASSAGTANATVANADHTHRGVASFAKTSGTLRYGAISLTQGTNIVVTDNGDGTFTLDVPTASTSTKGATQLATTSTDVSGSASSGGTANATVANADHTHRGIASFAKTSGTLRYGAVSLTPGSGIAITDNGDGTFTIASTGSFSNPMTTLGDTIYEDATPAPARLAGNTTTTKKFLTQTGTGSVSAAPGWNTISASDLPLTAPTTQIFTSGSGTYTKPAGVLYLKVRIVGGGGGGGGSGSTGVTAGSNGGNTTFGSSFLTANGGTGGTAPPGGSGSTATGGTATGGDINITGGTGEGKPAGVNNAKNGGNGGSNPLGFGGPGSTGNQASPEAGFAATGYGGGGGGASNNAASTGGGGGGAGGFLEKIITSPSGTYAYAVGAAGGGGSAGTSGNTGGTGTDGIIIVEEYYQ